MLRLLRFTVDAELAAGISLTEALLLIKWLPQN